MCVDNDYKELLIFFSNLIDKKFKSSKKINFKLITFLIKLFILSKLKFLNIN